MTGTNQSQGDSDPIRKRLLEAFEFHPQWCEESLGDELRNAQTRYLTQRVMEPKPSGWIHTNDWRDLTIRKIAAHARGITLEKGMRVPTATDAERQAILDLLDRRSR